MELEHPDEDRGETAKQRLDRNLNELLGELRVALPGVQVLFAFLLAVPFNQRFGKASSFERADYFATLVLTALASALLIAPSAYHRLEFRQNDKAHVVRVANRFAIAGFGFLACAMTAAVLFVTNFLYSSVMAIVTSVAAAIVFSTLWYVLPLGRRRRVRRQRAGAEPGGVAVALPDGTEPARDPRARR